MEQLLSNLTNAGLVADGYITLDDFQRVTVTDFTTLFGSTDGSYAALVAADDNGDGTTKGYSRFFDAWHTSAII